MALAAGSLSSPSLPGGTAFLRSGLFQGNKTPMFFRVPGNTDAMPCHYPAEVLSENENENEKFSGCTGVGTPGNISMNHVGSRGYHVIPDFFQIKKKKKKEHYPNKAGWPTNVERPI